MATTIFAPVEGIILNDRAWSMLLASPESILLRYEALVADHELRQSRHSAAAERRSDARLAREAAISTQHFYLISCTNARQAPDPNHVAKHDRAVDGATRALETATADFERAAKAANVARDVLLDVCGHINTVAMTGGAS